MNFSISKLLKLYIAIFAIVWYVPVWAYDFVADSLAYVLNDDGVSVSVTRISDSEDNYSDLTSIVIPSHVVHSGSEYPVTGIKTRAFSDCESVMSVSLPASITTIGADAFSDCPLLITVNISDLNAWCGIDFANEAANPLYPRYICVNGYDMPLTVFYRYKTLAVNGNEVTNLCIPDGVEEIKPHAFVGFSGTTLSLPSSLQTVGNGAFASCKNLKNIYVEDLESWLSIDFATASSNPLYGVYDDVIYEWEESYYGIKYTVTVTGKLFNQKELYVADRRLSDLVIPEGVTQIKPYAFITNSGYAIASFPSTLNAIGRQALQTTYYTDFSGSEETCGEIKTLIWNAKNCATTGDMNTEGIEHLVIGNGVETLPDKLAFGSKIESVSIPASVKKIGNGTFEYCSELRDIYAAPATAPTCEATTFANVDKSAVSLHIESGAMSSYFTAQVWKEFSKLQGDLVTPTQLTLNQTTASIMRQGMWQLHATVTPSNATTPVTWHSSDPSIAMVDANGLVRGVKDGETDIIATCFNLVAVCHVAVADQMIVVTLDKHLLEMNPNEIATLVPSISGGTATLIATSSDERVAMARLSGNLIQVLAVNPGEAVITVSTAAGNCQPDSCRVIVNGNDVPSGDINADGRVDISDVNAVINMMLGKGNLTAVDVTGDGQVDISDVNAVINAMLGKE